MSKKVKLGNEVQDKITGFKGIVIGRSIWLTGCDQVAVKPKVDKDGNMKEAQWFDAGSVEVIGKGIAASEVKSEEGDGGPRTDQPRL